MLSGREGAAERGLELRLREIAHDLHGRAAGRRPAFFEPRDWLRRAIDQSLGNRDLRTALFRFVDVLPSLRSAADVGRHLEEYFARSDHALGTLTILAHALHANWLVAPVVRQNVTSLARRFIAEEETSPLARLLESLRGEGAGFTLDVVGEAVLSTGEALAMAGRYERILGELADRGRAWPEVPAVDGSPRGEVPRVSLSVKLSSLYARFDALDAEAERVAADRLRRILREAARLGAAVTIDMEDRSKKDATLAIFRGLLEEEEFREAPAAAIAMQAYLPETAADLEALVGWAAEKRRRIGVRLIKGAYWDSEIAWARQKGWPVPVYTDKAATDAAYERLTRFLLDHEDVVEAAFGSHNLRSLAHAIACAEARGLAPGSYEIQMLYGMAEPLRHALAERGERLRVYVPVGDLIPGMAYLIRRLLENTSNVSFLRQSYGEGEDLETLLAAPATGADGREESPPGTQGRSTPGKRRRRHHDDAPGVGATEPPEAEGFRNEPLLDFSREPVRERFGAALDAVRAALPDAERNGDSGDGRFLVSRNPAQPEEVIGRVTIAGDEAVDEAVEGAQRAFADWSGLEVGERAAIVRRAAAAMRERREELAATIVLEVGKGWRDADADVAEAVDLLEYYAAEALRVVRVVPTEVLPGESNELRYEPLGPVAVIAPWNFPLAIAAGMTGAALVAGNTVCFKPAEQSPILGARVHRLFREAGVPEGALRLLQGYGRTGARLVRHPAIRAIAFTGSRAVGLEILRAAAEVGPDARHVKRAICEMGGKNAILVDEDADADEAIPGILESAFGYQGQKCSACSRLIVVGAGYEPFLRRLAAAARTLRVGPPEDPRNDVGPLIDEEAVRRLAGAIRRARAEGRVVLDTSLGGEGNDGAVEGRFVGPVIADGLAPDHDLAREELFGPLLVAFRARTFEEAVEIANATPYGLTGGVFSRSPARLELARRELRVGNLYLNRGITGAVVRRQPFGGIGLSGIGWKAGGPDYVKQFLESRTVSENTLRHGFAPEIG